MMFESTEPSLMVAACKVLSMRWTWLAFSRVSCLRARVRSRSACSESEGTKLGRMRPWASRSASHVASFTSVLRPGTALTGWALASTSSKSPAKTAQTGFQYTPVASIATAVTPWPVSHSESRSNSAVVVAKVSTNRTTPPASAKRTQATMVSRWMSSPAQRVEDVHDRLPLRTAPAGSPGQSNSRMRAPALKPGNSAGCSGGSGSNLYTGSRHQERTDLRADAALHYTPFHPARVRFRPVGNLYQPARSEER